MDDSFFDVVIFGTGLTESILAAALAKAGFKIAHIDENNYYGGQEASLSLDEFVQWADSQSSASSTCFSSFARSPDVPSQSRQYSICLSPSVIPSVGPIIDSLIASGVSRYGGFRLLDGVAIYNKQGHVKNVPATKEDIFKSKDISLVDKRRLMRFLMFAISDFEDKKELEGKERLPFEDFLRDVFSLDANLRTEITFSLAYCFSASDPTLPALQRIRRFLRSTGRYGSSSFLIGHYGGIGEIAQGFCRAAAVSGGVYILGRRIVSVSPTSTLDSPDSEEPSPRYSVHLEDFPDALTCNLIVSSSYFPFHLSLPDVQKLPPAFTYQRQFQSIARCVAIVDFPLHFPPPSSISQESGQDDDENDAESRSADEQNDEAGPSQASPRPIDTGIIIFPPSTVPGGSTTAAATAFINGEGTMSTPKGKCRLLYLSLPVTSEASDKSSTELLQPYLDAVLALSDPASSSLLPRTTDESPHSPSPAEPRSPLFTTFYIQHSTPNANDHLAVANDAGGNWNSTSKRRCCIVVPPLTPVLPLPDVPDAAAVQAEAVFSEAVKALRSHANAQAITSRDDDETISFWPPLDEVDMEGDEA